MAVAGGVDGTPEPVPRWGRLSDVPGVHVGHAQRVGEGWLSGVTVVLPPPGTVGSVDVRGGGPGTHETDALDPTTLVPHVDAVVLTGGSAFGLVSASGVQEWCLADGRGFPAGPPDDPRSILVPIVPAAAIFDLGRGGDPFARPGPEMGREAAIDAAAGHVEFARGAVGAGTGAMMAYQGLKGGVGTASVRLADGLVVGAIAVVNAMGTPVDPVTGALLGTAFIPPGRPRPRPPVREEVAGPYGDAGEPGSAANTTLAVVATNAALDVAQSKRMATAAHDGIARALTPAHTLVDGDTIFSLATGEVEVDLARLIAVQAAAADAVLLAILDAVLTSRGLPGG
jgi:L-aminopeptidase/D-esterase-like protein